MLGLDEAACIHKSCFQLELRFLAEMEADQKEHNTLWRYEGQMRHRTSGLTRMEKTHLTNMNATLCGQLEADHRAAGVCGGRAHTVPWSSLDTGKVSAVGEEE